MIVTLKHITNKSLVLFITFENLNDKKKFWIFLEMFFILKIDQLTAFSQTKKLKRPTIQKNTKK